MARIPDSDLERIKREIPLEGLAKAAGLELEKAGKDLRSRCPFHDGDEDPSLFIDPRKNLFHCFGCGAKGSVIDWRMQLDGVGFRTAAEKLAEEFLPGLIDKPVAPEPFSEEELRFLTEAPDGEVLGLIAAYYRERLDVDPRGSEYLAARGVLSDELIEEFRIGFADRTLGLRLRGPGGRAARQRLQALGVLREATGHEHLNGSIVAPILDSDRQVVQMYGRKVTPNLRKGTPAHLYLPGSLDVVYNPQALIDSDEVIVCESIIDAWTFWAAGFRSVTTTFGSRSFPDSLFEALLGHGARRVLIAFDRDEAGEHGARAAAKRLLASGIECSRVLFPKGMDANDYARQVQPAQKSLELALRRAESMGESRPPVVPEKEEATEEKAAKKKAAPEKASLAARPAPAPPAPDPSGDREIAVSSVVPAMPAREMPEEISDHEVILIAGDPDGDPRRFRIRGLTKNLSYDVLKVNVLVSRMKSGEETFHVDTLDLYSARQRTLFVKQAAIELGLEPKVVKQDLGRVLLRLEALQDEQIQAALEPQETKSELAPAEKEEAMELLRNPRLLDRILEDFERVGVVGEETNKLVGYLAAVSRKLFRPLAVLIQSSSAAGKSALMDAIASFVPECELVQYSAMTGQSLFYMGENDLRHKVLSIAEEEGAERASYALKLLQSEGKLSIASTGKDPQSGRLVTHEYHVEGPVAILLTTTSIEIDEELLNRCLVLTVDEGREQTQAIHRMQRERETLQGQLRLRDRERVRALHRNAQSLLEPLMVVNPYAEGLCFPDSCTRTRRDHEKYLGLIRSIALLFQHQREHKTRTERGEEVTYIEVELDDIEIANRLAHEILGRTLDELPPQTRRLLLLLDELVGHECAELGLERIDHRFTRRWLREKTGWRDTQLRVHLSRLVELEYVLVREGSWGRRFVYELIWSSPAEVGERSLPGLIDTSKLERREYDASFAGEKPQSAGRSRVECAPLAGTSRGELSEAKKGDSPRKRPISRENTYTDAENVPPRHSQKRRNTAGQAAMAS